MSITDSEWLTVLADYAKQHGQKQAGKKIGYSGGLVSSVLKGAYKGDLQRVQTAVEGALMGQSVECPVVGDIPRQACVGHQRRAHNPRATNPSRVALAEACPKCPNASQAKPAQEKP